MQHGSVQKLFQEQVEHYSSTNISVYGSPIIDQSLKWIKSHSKKKLRICEFGGGGGNLLAIIDKKIKVPTELFNVEIVKEYQKKQASKKIQFYRGSVLKSKFPDDSFDIIIMRDVLHHLVGKNYADTQNNQLMALKELKRLVKPRGAIFIEEIIESTKISSIIIYSLSKMNSYLGFRIPSLEITPHTVVSFLTSNELLKNIKFIFGSKVTLTKSIIAFDKHWQAKLVHLGGTSKKIIMKIELK